ncbi:MAG TPA: hypothetical protein VJP77_06080 [Planctomycetota bacterium]|nr:hypothetical protein [Planctomycetota bacterium]
MKPMRYAFLPLALLAAAAPLAAQTPPQLLHLQARLADAGGTPLAGPVAVRVEIHDSLVGGNLLWFEDENATALAGVVDLQLGDGTALPANLFSAGNRWLTLRVNGDAEMTPRQRIASAPYALRAGTVTSLDPTTTLPPGIVNQTHLAVGAVGAAALQTSAVTLGKIAPGAVNSNALSGGAVSSVHVADGALTNADLSAGAAIAGTKVSPNFGGQDVVTLGHVGAGTAAPVARVHSVDAFTNAVVGESQQASAIYGTTQAATTGFPFFLPVGGVHGVNHATGGPGVVGEGFGASSIGVLGMAYDSGSFAGRFANNAASGTALMATGFRGGRFETTATSGDALQASASATSGPAWGVRADTQSTSGIAVRGEAFASSGTCYGVYGIASSPQGFAGYFRNNAAGSGAYVEGAGLGASQAALRVHNPQSTQGMAAFISNSSGFHTAHLENFSDLAGGGVLWLKNRAGGTFITAVDENNEWQFWVDKNGKTSTKVLQILGGSDLSEGFDVAPAEVEALAPEPGLVVCIDPERPGKLVVSSRAYDRTVAGVLSGAGGVQPGMVMSQEGSVADGEHPVALTGRVFVRCDAGERPIAPGDLLTTAERAGHAMRADDAARAQGAILGKAMTGLESGTGLVLVLVSLQ